MAFDPDAFLERTQPEPVENTANQPAPVQQETGGFDPDQFLRPPVQTELGSETSVEPFPQYAVPGPTGFSGSAVKQTLQPFAQIPARVFNSYGSGISGAGKAVADTLMATHGMPPVFGTASALKGLHETYGALKEAANTGQALASRIATTPGLQNTFNQLMDTLPKSEAARLTNLITERGAQGMKEFFDTASDAVRAMPEARELTQLVPSRMQQIGRVIAPVIRGAAKVAGPVGMAMNAYDASQYAQESGLGQRLAQGQGLQAEQAFRQRNTQYGAPISPEQAQAVLQSGSPRDIEGLGGQEFLNSVIRQQAAAQALKPVRPVRPQQQIQGQ
jgi:hypothetical protein